MDHLAGCRCRWILSRLSVFILLSEVDYNYFLSMGSKIRAALAVGRYKYNSFFLLLQLLLKIKVKFVLLFLLLAYFVLRLKKLRITHGNRTCVFVTWKTKCLSSF